jgi:hypothetical protein
VEASEFLWSVSNYFLNSSDLVENIYGVYYKNDEHSLACVHARAHMFVSFGCLRALRRPPQASVRARARARERESERGRAHERCALALSASERAKERKSESESESL